MKKKTSMLSGGQGEVLFLEKEESKKMECEIIIIFIEEEEDMELALYFIFCLCFFFSVRAFGLQLDGFLVVYVLSLIATITSMIRENLRRSGSVRFPPQTQLSREPEFIRPLRVQQRDYSYSTLTAPSATLPSGLLVPAPPG